MPGHQWSYRLSGAENGAVLGPISERALVLEIDAGRVNPDFEVVSSTRTDDRWYRLPKIPALMRVWNRGFEQRQATSIFLSYGRRDTGDLPQRLQAEMVRRGYQTVWRDADEITVGDDWRDVIRRGIRDTQVFVAILSPQSVRRGVDADNAAGDDSVCLNEIVEAVQQRKPIVPLKAVACDSPFSIVHLDYVNLIGWQDSDEIYRAGVERLMDGIQAAARGKKRYRSWFHSLKGWDFTSYLDDKRRHFCGRQWLFDEIEDWLHRAENERVLLITGDPGTGKSAIVAELVHQNPGGRVLAYHCCQADTQDTLNPGRMVRSLAAMIASKLDGYAAQLDDPDVRDALTEAHCQDDPASAFERGILIPLAALPDPAGRCCLLIDALDESLAWTGKQPIASLLSTHASRLPAWLRIVATTRKEGTILHRLAALRANELSSQDPRNSADVQEYIGTRLRHANLARRLRESGRSVDDVSRILQNKSRGLFLYVREALDAIETDTYGFDRLEELPPRLFDLYERFFDRHFPNDEGFEPARKLLQVICAAREPLTEEQLARATGFNRDDQLAPLLRRLNSQLPPRVDQDGIRRYSVFHKSLADWLTSPELRGLRYYVSANHGHQLLADACWLELQQRGRETSSYSVSHLIEHLVSAERLRDVSAVLTNFQYLETKTQAGKLIGLVDDYSQGLAHIRGPESECLQAIQGALLLSFHVLADDPNQLASQLVGRLGNHSHDDVRAFLSAIDRSTTISWLRPLTSNLTSPGGALFCTLSGHSGVITAVAISDDGRWAVTASTDLTVRFWNLQSGAELLTMTGHEDRILAIAISPDGTRAVTASRDRTARVWNLKEGSEQFTLRHEAAVGAVAISRDGRQAITGCGDSNVRVWDLTTGAELQNLMGHTGWIQAVALTDDGNHAVSCSKNVLPDDEPTFKVWDLRTAAAVRSEPASLSAISANGKFLASVDASELRIRDWQQDTTRVIPKKVWGVVQMALTRSARTLVTNSNTGLTVWDVDTGREMLQLNGHLSRVRAVAVAEDGKRALTGADDRTAKVWSLTDAKSAVAYPAHNAKITALATSNGRAYSAAANGEVKAWDVESGEELHLLKRASDAVIESLCLLGDGRYLVGHSPFFVSAWELESQKEVFRLQDFPSRITAIATAHEGRTVITVGIDACVRKWELSSDMAPAVTLIGHPSRISAAAITPDGRRAATRCYRELRLWDLENDKLVAKQRAPYAYESQVAISSDGSLVVSADENGHVLVWDGQEAVQCLGIHGTPVTRLACSSDDQWAVTGFEDGMVKLWDLEQRAQRSVHAAHQGPVTDIVISLDGKYWISTSRDQTIQVWELMRGQPVARFRGESPLLACLACTGNYLVAGDESGRIHALRLYTAKV